MEWVWSGGLMMVKSSEIRGIMAEVDSKTSALIAIPDLGAVGS